MILANGVPKSEVWGLRSEARKTRKLENMAKVNV